MIRAFIRGRTVRFFWPCGCWLSFTSDQDPVTPFVGDAYPEDDSFLPWRLADLHRWRWIGEGVCLDPLHGYDPEAKRELRGRAKTSRVVDLDVEEEIQPTDPFARLHDPVYDLHPPIHPEVPPCP